MQVWRDDSQIIIAHPAGAADMIGAVGVGADKCINIGVVGDIGAGRYLGSADFVKGGLRRNLAGHPDAFAKHAPVRLGL